jgi:hypothetical protein
MISEPDSHHHAPLETRRRQKDVHQLTAQLDLPPRAMFLAVVRDRPTTLNCVILLSVPVIFLLLTIAGFLLLPLSPAAAGAAPVIVTWSVSRGGPSSVSWAIRTAGSTSGSPSRR